MSRIVILGLLLAPYITFAQNFKKRKTPTIGIEASGGYPFAALGFSYDFRTNTSFKVYRLNSLMDSLNSGNEWIGMTQSIQLENHSSIHFGLGMFAQFERSLQFDIAPILQYEYSFTDDLSLTAGYMHVFPDKWKDKNINNLQFGAKYSIPAIGSNNGIARPRKSGSNEVFTSFAFGAYYSMGGISFLTSENFGFDLRGYTDLGYLFNVKESLDLQCISLLYSLNASKDISFDSYLGIAATLQSNTKFHSLYFSERMRVRLIDNLWFSLEVTQNSMPVVRERIQPLIHSGFVIAL